MMLKSMLTKLSAVLLMSAVSSLSANTVSAGDVTVEGVHLCCGGCVNAVNKAVSGVTGISGVTVDRGEETVKFSAADNAAAKKAIEAMANAGFSGKAKHAGEDIAFPATGAKKDTASNEVVFSGVHLCCGACIRDVRDAVSGVAGVSEVEVDRGAGTVTLIGTGIKHVEAAAALTGHGFFGKISG